MEWQLDLQHQTSTLQPATRPAAMVWTKFWKLALAYDGFWGKDALKVKFSQIFLKPPLFCFVLGGLVVFCYQSFAEYVYIYIEFTWDEWLRSCPRAGLTPIPSFRNKNCGIEVEHALPTQSSSGEPTFGGSFAWNHLSHLNMLVDTQWFPSWTISQRFGRRINVNQGLNQPHWATILHFWMACGGMCI